MSKATEKTPDARPLAELLTLPPDAELNPEEVRIYANLKSRQAVYNWLKVGDDPLPASKVGGWRIRKRDLDAYLNKKRNRRESDKHEQGTTDDTLQKQLGYLIEIGQAVIAWKRASTVFRAAADTFNTFSVPPDEEWINKCFDDMQSKRDSLTRLSNSLTDETLTGLRFMLPSIHSDLALAQSNERTATPKVKVAAPLKTSKRKR